MNRVARTAPSPSAPPAQCRYDTPPRKTPIAITARATMSTWWGSSATVGRVGRLASIERRARGGGDLRRGLGLGRDFVLVAISEVVASTAAPGLLPRTPGRGVGSRPAAGRARPSLRV